MGYVYVLYNSESELIKIGKTKNPQQRLSCLSNANGSKFRYYITQPMYIEGLIEKVMHSKYDRYRTKGEWFSSILFEDVVQTLKDILSSDDFNRRNIKH